MLSLLLASLVSAISVHDLHGPEGFDITIYAKDIDNVRQLAIGDRGTVFAGSRQAGNVYAISDTDKDGVADKVAVIDEDLNMPSGVAFSEGALYVAAVDRILRYDAIEDHLDDPPAPTVIIADLPDDTHHGWKAIEFDHSNNLYIPVGVPCNVCLSEDPRHGTILRYELSTKKITIYATGVRNSVGLAIHPQDQSLWFSDNGRDWLGDDVPPDEINRADKAGNNFGFPYLHGRHVLDPDYGEMAIPEDYTLPMVELGAHVAPLGLAFYTGNAFPKSYRHALFVAEHGSWNRSKKTGYRIVSIRQDNSGKYQVTPFITGWLDREKDTAWGRPVDILNLPDGSLLISDDYADVIYRVTYHNDG